MLNQWDVQVGEFIYTSRHGVEAIGTEVLMLQDEIVGVVTVMFILWAIRLCICLFE